MFVPRGLFTFTQPSSSSLHHTMTQSNADCSSTHSTLSHSILTWLSNVHSPAKKNRKRALAEVHCNVMTSHSRASSNKRRRQTDRDEEPLGDVDATPRAAGQKSQILYDAPVDLSAASSSSRDSLASHSSKSHRSKSPVKRLVATRLRPQPISLKHFDAPGVALPNGLADVLSVMKRLGRGWGVLDTSSRVSFSAVRLPKSVSGNMIANGNVERYSERVHA